MGHLRGLPRGDALAQQGRWQRAASAHLPSHANIPAPVVPRRNENCFRRDGARAALESLRRFNRGRRARADDQRGGGRGRRWLVSRREIPCLWIDEFLARALCCPLARLDDAPDFNASWLGWTLLSPVVSERPLPRGDARDRSD